MPKIVVSRFGRPKPPPWLTQWFDRLVKLLEQILEALKRPAGSPAPPTVGLAVTVVKGRPPMAIKPVPPLTMSDVQQVQLSLAPKLFDGSDDPGPFAWSSSDPTNFPIVGDTVDTNGNHVPDPANTSPTGTVVWVTTPTDVPGAATITATSASPNVDGNSIDLTVVEGRTGNVNLSAGVPVSDQP